MENKCLAKYLKCEIKFKSEAFEKGKEYMVWFKGERFIGKFETVSKDGLELCFWTYGGGRVIHNIENPDDIFILPLDEIIPERFLHDTPPIIKEI